MNDQERLEQPNPTADPLLTVLAGNSGLTADAILAAIAAGDVDTLLKLQPTTGVMEKLMAPRSGTKQDGTDRLDTSSEHSPK